MAAVPKELDSVQPAVCLKQAELDSSSHRSGIQTLDKPWVSEADIESGANWSTTIGTQLEGAKFGIVCVTQANQDRPWLNFETGAISKLVGGAVPLLIDLKKVTDLSAGPMSQLQACLPDKEGMTKLLADINARLERPLDQAVWQKTLNWSWDDFEARLAKIRDIEPTPKAVTRDRDDKIDEVLELVRVIASNTSRVGFQDSESWQHFEPLQRLDPLVRSTLITQVLRRTDSPTDFRRVLNYAAQRLSRMANDRITGTDVDAAVDIAVRRLDQRGGVRETEPQTE